MKRLSIRAKVTMWFTVFMIVLNIVVFAVLYVVGKKESDKGLQESAMTVVEKQCKNLKWKEKKQEVKVKKDFKTYSKGVYVSIYDSEGNLVEGNDTVVDYGDMSLQDHKIRKVVPTEKSWYQGEWYVYDRQYYFDQVNYVWVRGMIAVDLSTQNYVRWLKIGVIVAPFLVFFVAIGGYMIITRALKPIGEITELANQISSGDNLSQRIRLTKGSDEIYQLAQTYDAMLERLEASFQRERQFTSDAAHELRTPLAVLQTQCEYALAGLDDQKLTEELLFGMLQTTKGMTTLVSQLLFLSRADQGRNELQLEKVNVSELTELVALQMEGIAKKKEISIETFLEKKIIMLVDETMLMRILCNVIENAIKYGRMGGTISISLKKMEDRVELVIGDNGIGMSQEQMAKIWDRFYQANPSRNKKEGGVGLGLSMVKTMVEVHGGFVRVESEEGVGSTFFISLPCKDA